jgi:hypothetical protein
MRWTPILVDVAIAIVVWTAVLGLERRLRARMTADPSPRSVQSYHLDRTGLICAAAGFTFFIAWLITDAVGPHWLHALARPAAGVLIAVAAALSGWAGWVRAR